MSWRKLPPKGHRPRQDHRQKISRRFPVHLPPAIIGRRGFCDLTPRMSHAARYSQRMELIIAGQSFAVLKIEEGTIERIHLTLDRAPQFKTRKEPIMLLVDGPNREPVQLVSLADGPRLVVRKIY